MLEKELKNIEFGGVQYPYKCTINVIEKLQDKYGTIQNFEVALKFKNQDVDAENLKLEIGIEPLCFALALMIQEGAEIIGNSVEITEKDIRLTAGDEYGLYELFEIVNKEFTRCFATKKRKKVKATQGITQK